MPGSLYFTDETFGTRRYMACLVERDGPPKFIDLGEAQAIDEAIISFREALRTPQRKDFAKLARAVDEKIMQPVRNVLAGTTHLLTSPDGLLNLVPFAALVDEQQQYLVERYSITYLTSGRDLLRLQIKQESSSEALVLNRTTQHWDSLPERALHESTRSLSLPVPYQCCVF